MVTLVVPKIRASVTLVVERETRTLPFAVLLDEMNTARPKGWVFGRLTLDAGERIVFGINPYAPAKQVFVPALGNNVDDICRPTHHGLQPTI